VNSHINRLRTKIEDDPRDPRRIVTVWGVGYRLDVAATPALAAAAQTATT
jgi:DNA-binding response OmpR family regulator